MLIKNQNRAKANAADIIEFSEVEEDNEHGFGRHSQKLELHLEDRPRK